MSASLALLSLLASAAGASAGEVDLAQLRYLGRVDHSDPRGPRLALAGSGFVLRFSGTGVEVTAAELPKTPSIEGKTWPNRFRVQLDDRPAFDVFADTAGWLLLSLADLPAGPHRLELYKQSEALVGTTQLTSVRVNGVVLPAEAGAARRLTFLGDSVTSGYGNEGDGPGCTFSSATENHWRSYDALVARSLDAEASAVSWSGRGLTRNFNAPPGAALLPAMLELVVPERTGGAVGESADAFVINVGANDFATGDPGERAFTRSYVALLGRVRAKYPHALIVATLGATLSDEWPQGAESRTKARRYISAAVERVRAKGDEHTVFFEMPRNPGELLGCDYHPGRESHLRMAQALAPFLAQQLGWTMHPWE